MSQNVVNYMDGVELMFGVKNVVKKCKTMSERKINLEEIMNKVLDDGRDYPRDINWYGCKRILEEFSNQILELAAENAETTYVCACGSTEFNPVSDGWSCKICGKDPLPEIEVDKQSILNTINQVE